MTYRLIAIDLDGTLLDPHLKISQHNLEVIKSAIDKGVMVTLSTGRMFAAALPFARELQLDVPLITCNGAAIICAKSKKVYFERPIPGELLLKIIEMGQRLNIELSLFTLEDIFVAEAGHNAHIHREIDSAQVKVADLTEVARQHSIIKILFFSANLYKDTEEFYQAFGQQCTFYFSLPWFTEIVARGVDKGDALKVLARKFSVEPEEIIAIGDNFNDLPMIQYAGLGVAMGNASEELKAEADFVSRSHDDDGVAHVIEKFVLI